MKEGNGKVSNGRVGGGHGTVLLIDTYNNIRRSVPISLLIFVWHLFVR